MVKFLVIRGKAKFKFKNILNKKEFDILTNSKELKIIETIPGLLIILKILEMKN